MNFIKQIYRRICNFFYWGWKLNDTCDWDYSSIYQVLHFKLDRMVKEMKPNKWYSWVGDSRMWKQLLIARELAKRLHGHDYFGPESEKLGIDFDDYLNKKEDEFFSRKVRMALEKSDSLEERDRKLLWKIMDKYSCHWWT